jgi:hypothetical protein
LGSVASLLNVGRLGLRYRDADCWIFCLFRHQSNAPELTKVQYKILCCRRYLFLVASPNLKPEHTNNKADRADRQAQPEKIDRPSGPTVLLSYPEILLWNTPIAFEGGLEKCV